VLVKAGQRDEARKILEELGRQQPDYLSPPFVAALNATLGEKDEAFAVLERAYEQRNPWLAFLNSPTFDSLRDDPRFAGFCRRIGLPESVSTHTGGQGWLPFLTTARASVDIPGHKVEQPSPGSGPPAGLEAITEESEVLYNPGLHSVNGKRMTKG